MPATQIEKGPVGLPAPDVTEMSTYIIVRPTTKGLAAGVSGFAVLANVTV